MRIVISKSTPFIEAVAYCVTLASLQKREQVPASFNYNPPKIDFLDDETSVEEIAELANADDTYLINLGGKLDNKKVFDFNLLEHVSIMDKLECITKHTDNNVYQALLGIINVGSKSGLDISSKKVVSMQQGPYNQDGYQTQPGFGRACHPHMHLHPHQQPYAVNGGYNPYFTPDNMFRELACKSIKVNSLGTSAILLDVVRSVLHLAAYNDKIEHTILHLQEEQMRRDNHTSTCEESEED